MCSSLTFPHSLCFQSLMADQPTNGARACGYYIVCSMFGVRRVFMVSPEISLFLLSCYTYATAVTSSAVQYHDCISPNLLPSVLAKLSRLFLCMGWGFLVYSHIAFSFFKFSTCSMFLFVKFSHFFVLMLTRFLWLLEECIAMVTCQAGS